jgi:signal transduction histidine kinase
VPYSGPRDEVGELVTTFNDMLAALERVTKAQRLFVQNASHELRAPLTSIKGNLEFLRGAANLPDEEQAAALADAASEAGRLATLVNDLLLLARVDAADSGYGPSEHWLDEQLRGRRELVALDEVVMAVFRQGRTQVQAKRKELHLSVSGLQPTMLRADPGQIRQLLLILMDNAIKYTPNGGKVRISLAQPEDGRAELTIEDSGIGISEHDLPHIFERFYRADRARARDEGTGLGLAIARWIVMAHRGTIAVRSTVGKGTTFTLRFKTEPRPAGATLPAPATPTLQKPTPPDTKAATKADAKGATRLGGAMEPLARIAVTTVSKSRRAAARSVRAVSAARRGGDGGTAGTSSGGSGAKHRGIKAPIARTGSGKRRRAKE